MTIRMPQPRSDDRQAATFIAGAAAPKVAQAGRVVVNLRMQTELLARIDAEARRLGSAVQHGCTSRPIGRSARLAGAGGLTCGAFTTEARLRASAALRARADAFAQSMAGTIAALEREGITSSAAMAKALNERGVATRRSGRWAASTVISLRRRLKRLGL